MILDGTAHCDDKARLAQLDKLAIMGTQPEREFDDLTELAAFICETPISLVSLVGADHQFFKSAKGFNRTETPRSQSFCVHAMELGSTLIVPNAQEDPRFRDNPLVTSDPKIRFYAGSPIYCDGQVLGSLCVIDKTPRTISRLQQDALERLARQASNLLDARLVAEHNRCLQEEAETGREHLQQALDAARIATWFYDPQRNIVGGDAQMGQFFGLEFPEGPAELWIASIVEEDRERVAEEFAASLAGAPYDTKYRVVVDDDVHWLHARAKVQVDPSGNVQMVGVCEDITREETLAAELVVAERRLAEERRLASERLAEERRLASERLRLALITNNATSFDWVPETDVVQWSGMPPFGIDPETLPTGASSLEYVQPEDLPGLSAVLDRAVEHGQPYAYEYRSRWVNGSIRWVRTAGQAFKEADGLTHFIGVNTDITERKLAEEALLHTEKLSAVGRLASVISHEINNPLEAVTNLLYIVRCSPSLSRDDREHLEAADRELARVGQVTAQTLRLHRNLDIPGLINADRLVQELVSLFRSRLTASSIRVKMNLGDDVTFTAFEGDIRQVLNALITNAFDAMRTGGKLHIRTRCCCDTKTGQMGASIAVADSGPGIPSDQRGRIFEAFHSTKGINGNGLGLWIAKRILQKHKGHLRFRTAVGHPHGTVFRLWLPLQVAETANEALT